MNIFHETISPGEVGNAGVQEGGPKSAGKGHRSGQCHIAHNLYRMRACYKRSGWYSRMAASDCMLV